MEEKKEKKMKVCRNCGAENFDIHTACTKCGSALSAPASYAGHLKSAPSITAKKAVYAESGLSTAVKVFMVISTVTGAIATLFYFVCWLLLLTALKETGVLPVSAWAGMMIMLAYTIVAFLMTNSYFRKIYEKVPIGTAFKICTLIFISTIAGILMLCDKNDGQKEVVILNEEAKPETKSIPEELIEYRKLLDQGIITQEEFDQKKRELLGL